MDRFFTSDLHLGHAFAAQERGFDDIEDHDIAVMESFESLPRRSKLWVLGDVAFAKESMKMLVMIPCQTKVLIMGNHDQYHAREYLQYFDDICGPVKYHDMWLTHHPIHPQEMYRAKGNIHGHIHKGGMTKPLAFPYFNVNWDFHKRAIPFDEMLNMQQNNT